MPTLARPDGTQIFYKLVGKDAGKPPLVLVHGWSSNHTHWIHQTKHFQRSHQVLLLDRRGHGKSTTCDSGHDATTHAADVLAVTKEAGLKGVVAIGHAGGGAGTLEFIRANPKLVKGGVLIDSGFYPKPTLGDPASPFGFRVGKMIDELQGPKSKSLFKAMYSGYFDKRCDRAASAQAVAEAASTPDAVKIAELEGLIVDVSAIGDGIKQKVLWLTAAGVDQSFIRSHLANVCFGQVVGAAHFPQFEQPAQTNAMIETFIGRL